MVEKRRSLASSHRKFSREWHPTKNGELAPRLVTAGSNKKVWWKCNKGHEWSTTIVDRTRQGTGCPYCSGRRATPRTSLKALYPLIARQWHPTKNGDFQPQNVRPGSSKKAWWKCREGHVWQARIAERVRRQRGCPYCAGQRVMPRTSLKARYPRIARQWHVTKNGDLKPQNVSPGSGKKAWWKCENGHVWCAAIYSRTKGCGCPYCAGRLVAPKTSLKALHYRVARQWHPTKNGDLKPQHVSGGSNKKVWWRCGEGHEWQARVADVARSGCGCPYCAGKRATPQTSLGALYPRVAREWHPTKNGKSKPSETLAMSAKRAWWRCRVGHVYEMPVRDRTARSRGCTKCVGL